MNTWNCMFSFRYVNMCLYIFTGYNFSSQVKILGWCENVESHAEEQRCSDLMHHVGGGKRKADHIWFCWTLFSCHDVNLQVEFTLICRKGQSLLNKHAVHTVSFYMLNVMIPSRLPGCWCWSRTRRSFSPRLTWLLLTSNVSWFQGTVQNVERQVWFC